MNNSCNNIIKVNPKSKFLVELKFFLNGEEINALTHTFKFIYQDTFGRNPYEVSHNYNNGEFVNCFVKDGKLYAKFEDFNFSEGVLKRIEYVEKEVTPDAGQGFTNNESLDIITCETNILITRSVNCCMSEIVGCEEIIVPAINPITGAYINENNHLIIDTPLGSFDAGLVKETEIKTVVFADTDLIIDATYFNKAIFTGNNPVTVTLPNSDDFTVNFEFEITKYGAGAVTVLIENGTFNRNKTQVMMYQTDTAISIKKVSTNDWSIVGIYE